MEKLQLLGLFQEELAEETAQYRLPAFRVKQLFQWLHRGVDFDGMSNLPKALREQLQQRYIAQPVTILQKKVSQLDGTVKMLYALPDGNCVEGVLMHYHHGWSLCVSTQVGCRMGCVFCASTLAGCVRNLTAAELLGQVHAANTLIDGGHVSNIVLMGSGEPLDNYDNVTRFLRLVSHPEGLNIGLRHISLSTCGLVPQMRRFAEEGLPVTLSLSLHAPNDALRTSMMPVNKRWPLRELMAACGDYADATSRRISFEYALVRDVNDTPECARQLGALLKGMLCHVNLIPVNEVAETGMKKSTTEHVKRFESLLSGMGFAVTVRRTLGSDINAACGQLRRSSMKE